jgi:hypothetical protein
MSKFSKKIKKIVRSPQYALVVGNGFGHLSDILDTFQTVFLISNDLIDMQDKKLIRRENFDNLSELSNIQLIIINLDCIDKLSFLSGVWQKNKPYILIEGYHPIERNFSAPLYNSGYRCFELFDEFHLWKKI